MQSELNKIKCPLRYVGGKQRAAKLIVDHFPEGIVEYREPMVGGASVFREAKVRGVSQKWWINDKFFPLFNFWVCLQSDTWNYKKDLGNLLSMTAAEKKVFFKAYQLNIANSALQNYQNYDWHNYHELATQYFFINRCSFSGATLCGGFSSSSSGDRFTQSSIDRLDGWREFLDDVFISFWSYEHLLEEEGQDVFVFLDPPYLTASKLYGNNGDLHEEFNHQELADKLNACKHKWLMTLDDCPEVRTLYKDCYIKPFELQYGMNNVKGNASKKGKELLIANYWLK